jgi:protein involved in polysaccharide export with SLBB domain
LRRVVAKPTTAAEPLRSTQTVRASTTKDRTQFRAFLPNAMNSNPPPDAFRRTVVHRCVAVSALALFAVVLSGCSTLRPLNGIPARGLPDELKPVSRNERWPIDLSLLRQRVPANPMDYRVDSGDVLGVYIDGVLDIREDGNFVALLLPMYNPADREQYPSIGFPVTVQDDGTIRLPSADPIPVRGLSIREIHDYLLHYYTQVNPILNPAARRGADADGNTPDRLPRDLKFFVNLQRPRVVRVIVLRQEAGNTQTATSLATIPSVPMYPEKRGVGRVVMLPAGRNDVANALAESGGLPGWDADPLIYVMRNRAIVNRQWMNRVNAARHDAVARAALLAEARSDRLPLDRTSSSTSQSILRAQSPDFHVPAELRSIRPGRDDAAGSSPGFSSHVGGAYALSGGSGSHTGYVAGAGPDMSAVQYAGGQAPASDRGQIQHAGFSTGPQFTLPESSGGSIHGNSIHGGSMNGGSIHGGGMTHASATGADNPWNGTPLGAAASAVGIPPRVSYAGAGSAGATPGGISPFAMRPTGSPSGGLGGTPFQPHPQFQSQHPIPSQHQLQPQHPFQTQYPHSQGTFDIPEEFLADPTILNPRNPYIVRIPTRLSPRERIPFTEDDILLHDGDIVFIDSRERDFFFTSGLLGGGQFLLPRDYDLDVVSAVQYVESQTRLSQTRQTKSIGGASVMNRDISAGASYLIILRRTPDGSIIPIKVDLHRALTDPSERVVIQTGDTLVLQYGPLEATYAAIERHLFEAFLIGAATTFLFNRP